MLFCGTSKATALQRRSGCNYFPSSILSKRNIYIKTREILLKYFDIVAIVEFGSGTFSKTDTNTITLFLRRKDNNPDIAEYYKNIQKKENYAKICFCSQARGN
jgi:type I restriction-modification system DNA methylase subunit